MIVTLSAHGGCGGLPTTSEDREAMFILTRQPRLAYDQAAADILAAQAALTAAQASIGLCQGRFRVLAERAKPHPTTTTTITINPEMQEFG